MVVVGLCRYNLSGHLMSLTVIIKIRYFPENEMRAFAKGRSTRRLSAPAMMDAGNAAGGDVVYCDPPCDGTFWRYAFCRDDQYHHSILERRSSEGHPLFIRDTRHVPLIS